MKPAKTLILLLLFSLAGTLLTGCHSAQPAPTATATSAILPTALVALETVPPTLTLQPSPSLTPLLTATWTLTPGPTNTRTPQARFSEAQVVAVLQHNAGYQLTLKVPGLAQALDVLLANLPYSCQMVAEAPQTLFCQGLSRPPIDQRIAIVFRDPADGQELYQGETYIIQAAVPTPTPAGYFSCPDRGKDVFCEVECRIYGGNPCIVATCNDACGLYYSIHDCPQDIPNDGICDPELEAQMRDKYGLPK